MSSINLQVSRPFVNHFIPPFARLTEDREQARTNKRNKKMAHC